MMLLKLVTARGLAGGDHVVSLGDEGEIGPRLRAVGATVSVLGIRKSVRSLAAAPRLAALAREWRPDIVCGWMYHGNLAALWAAREAGGVPCVWGIRQTFGGYSRERVLTRAVIWAGARLSRRPACILYNSRASLEQHRFLGYASAHSDVIPNGFDVDRFRPDETAGARLRAELGLTDRTLLIGQVARLHPMKNHVGMIRAVARLRSGGADVHLVMAGRGVTPESQELAAQVRASGMEGSVSLLGERRDTALLLAGMDVVCSPSGWGEGFPNVVGEAMACGVPCVVTDVGDSGFVVGDTGSIVPSGDEEQLVQALRHWTNVTPECRHSAGQRARRRVVDLFSIDRVTSDFYDRLQTIVMSRAPS